MAPRAKRKEFKDDLSRHTLEYLIDNYCTEETFHKHEK